MPTPQSRSRAGRLAGLAASAGAALTLWAGSALAAAPAGEHGGEHASGGLPQLDPTTFPPQLVWLAISFAALYLLMSKVALPRVAEVVEERQDRITADLEKAQSLRDEAGTVIAAYEKSASDARGEAQAAIARASGEISQVQSARQAAFASETAAKTRAAEERIAAARDQAVANVRSIAAEVAQAAAERIAGVRVDTAEAEAAVGASMGRA